jgi:hypothetical protein
MNYINWVKRAVMGLALAGALLGGTGVVLADGYNPAARKIWSTVTVRESVGTSWGCTNLRGNPLGYYSVYHVYWGWIWVDSNGVWSPGWFADGSTGPREIVGSYRYLRCGIP